MAIEDQIAALVKSTDANTAVLAELVAVSKDMLALRTDAIETVKGSATTAKKTTTAAGAGATGTTKTEEKKTDTAPAVDYTVVEAAIAKYVSAAGWPEEREARNAKVVYLLANDKLRNPAFTAEQVKAAPSSNHVNPEKIAAFVKNIEKLINDGNLTQEPEAPSGGDDDIV